MPPVTLAIKKHGGKGAFNGKLARWIISLMPRHRTYCEPYFGGGAVLFHRDPNDQTLWLPGEKGVSEVVNDLDYRLTNFWSVIQSPQLFEKFHRKVQAVPFSGVEWERAKYRVSQAPSTGFTGYSVELAVHFFVIARQSLAGREDAFTSITKSRLRGETNAEVSAWLNAIEGLPQVHNRLKRVLILPPQPALEAIRKMDHPDTLMYLDPPYHPDTRASGGVYGQFEMTANDHEELLQALTGVEGKFILSGYRHSLYDSYAEQMGWYRKDFPISNNAAGGKSKEVMTENVWCNYDPDQRLLT